MHSYVAYTHKRNNLVIFVNVDYYKIKQRKLRSNYNVNFVNNSCYFYSLN